jgi:glucan biosynthesis protein C
MGIVGKAERYYEFDWLRVLGMFVIFLFHNARFFNEEDWHVKNVDLSFGMTVIVGILGHFIMPLFFLLSAFAIRYALKKRTNVEFIKERVNRLLIPLGVGIFTHIILQVYIENITHGRFSGSLWQFIPHYFDGWYGFGGNFAWMGLHLWYLLILFLFSWLLLPLFQYINRSAKITTYLVNIGSRRFGPYLFIILILLMEWFVSFSMETVGRRDFGGWSVLTYLIFFVSGYILATDRRYFSSIQNLRFISLALSLLTVFMGYFLLVEWNFPGDHIFYLMIRAVNSWSWLMAFVGFAGVHLKFSNRFLKYANEAVLPFYILHQTVIVVIGYFIRGWGWPVFPKFLFLTAVAFITIMGLYALVIKRSGSLRYLFGTKRF